MKQTKPVDGSDGVQPSGGVDREGEMANYPIALAIERALTRYFKDLNGTTPCDLYDLVMKEVEKPLLRAVMSQSGGNSSRAAQMLGINRNTLRKKLRQHALDGVSRNGHT